VGKEARGGDGWKPEGREKGERANAAASKARKRDGLVVPSQEVDISQRRTGCKAGSGRERSPYICFPP
jgi:hypothetical protein